MNINRDADAFELNIDDEAVLHEKRVEPTISQNSQARAEQKKPKSPPAKKSGLPRLVPLAFVAIGAVALVSTFLDHEPEEKAVNPNKSTTASTVVANVETWQKKVEEAGERKSTLQPAPHISTAAWMLQGASNNIASKNQTMSFWFDQDFIANGERWHFYFFHLEMPDSRVDVGAKVGLVVFRLLPIGQWVPVSVNPNFTDNGSRGLATQQKQVQFMAISADSHVMTLLNNVDTFEGTKSYFDLFAFTGDGELRAAGRIDAGMNNLNMQCDGDDPIPTGFNRACVSYTGELRVMPIKSGQTVSDLRVEYKGQNAEPAKTYSYLGGSWQAREESW